MRTKSLFAARLGAIFETVFKGPKMRKPRPETTKSKHFPEALDELIATHRSAGASAREIARTLTARAEGMRAIAAVNINLSTTPKLHDAWGRPIN